MGDLGSSRAAGTPSAPIPGNACTTVSRNDQRVCNRQRPAGGGLQTFVGLRRRVRNPVFQPTEYPWFGQPVCRLPGAALQGKSMQEFLRAELERLAARPSVEAWLQQVRKRKRSTRTRVSARQILEQRDADRR